MAKCYYYSVLQNTRFYLGQKIRKKENYMLILQLLLSFFLNVHHIPPLSTKHKDKYVWWGVVQHVSILTLGVTSPWVISNWKYTTALSLSTYIYICIYLLLLRKGKNNTHVLAEGWINKTQLLALLYPFIKGPALQAGVTRVCVCCGYVSAGQEIPHFTGNECCRWLVCLLCVYVCEWAFPMHLWE